MSRPAHAARQPIQRHFQFDTVVGGGTAFQRVLASVAMVAPTGITALIQGETGTGKSVIARAIHQNSPRRHSPFVTFNAAAIPDGRAETELCGYVMGAFASGGRFEQADGGTLFIDEVSSMSLPMQTKLLHALEEREVRRVGDSYAFAFDVRVIAATNMDLRKAVEAGTFRQDLFYRLSIAPIVVPPLRDRRDDVPMLAHYFVRKSCGRNHLRPRSVNDEAMRALVSYSWPGNVRQLENAMEHAVVMSGHAPEISPAVLPEEIRWPDQPPVSSCSRRLVLVRG